MFPGGGKMLTDFLNDMFRRFGGEFVTWSEEDTPGPKCERNLDQAVDFVVEETSSRLRAVSGYARRLRKPVATTFQYIDKIIEQVPGVFPCRRSAFSEDPMVNAIFVNYTHLQEVFSESKEVRELFYTNPAAEECHALLCMQRKERRQLGMALVGDEVRKDVLQATVSFTDHQVVSPGVQEADTRCALKCCVFKSLIAHIRSEANRARTRSSDLQTRHRTLRSRLKRLEAESVHGTAGNELVRQIDAIEKELQNLEPRLVSLEDHFQYVADVLSHPDQYLSSYKQEIYIDRMGIKQKDDTGGTTRKLSLDEIQIAHQHPRVAALVRFPREELLPEKDFLRESSIFLAQ